MNGLARVVAATLSLGCAAAAVVLFLTGNPTAYWLVAAQWVFLVALTYLTVNR